MLVAQGTQKHAVNCAYGYMYLKLSTRPREQNLHSAVEATQLNGAST